MIYLLFIVVNCGYLSLLSKCRKLSLGQTLLFGLPMLMMWSLLIGGQYNVGTDYFSYMEMFVPGANLAYVNESRGEYAFSWFVEACQHLGVYGQGIFFVIAAVWSVIYLYIAYSLVGSKYIYLFLFVFIVFTGAFNNQMNGIRQYFAMYLLWLAIILIRKKRYVVSIALFVVIPFFHQSSLVVMVIFPVLYYWVSEWRKSTWLYGILVTGMICSLLISDDVIAFFLPYFDQYSGYFGSEKMDSQKSLLILTKYVCMPLFLYAIYIYPRMDLTNYQRKLFVFGLCGYAFKLSVVSMSLVSRLGLYFELFSCIPLVYLLIYLKMNSRKLVYILVLIYLLLPYSLKVIMSNTGEYSYNFFLSLN